MINERTRSIDLNIIQCLPSENTALSQITAQLSQHSVNEPASSITIAIDHRTQSELKIAWK